MTTQLTLEMRPATERPRPKKGARARQYVFPPEVIVMVDYLAMISGKPKGDIVADAVRIAAIIMRNMPEAARKMAEEKSLEPLMDAIDDMDDRFRPTFSVF